MSKQPDAPLTASEITKEKRRKAQLARREKQRREKEAQQAARASREKNLRWQETARAIREGDYPQAILAAVKGAIDSVGNTEEYPADDLADACWNCFVEVAQLANDEDVPKATRLAYAQTLVHAAAVAEYRLAVESDCRGTGIAENLNYDEVMRDMLQADRIRLVNAVRRLVDSGEIGIDEIDRPPDVVDD